MDARSLAIQAGADNLSPARYIKDVLAASSPVLPISTGDNVFLPGISPDIGRALLNEAIRYILRSMSQLVSYEVIYNKRQFSWALVTLYYSNYFSVLSMNRLAGSAISTVEQSAKHYEIAAVPNRFTITRINRNNHELVWKTNYRLYQNFNWSDSSCDETIINVSTTNQNYYEKKRREYMNYHPDSYTELFQENSNRSSSLSLFGKNYTNQPDNILLLFKSDLNSLEGTIANLECRAVYRQIIVLTILSEVKKNLATGSKIILVDYFRSFSKNIMDKSPFKSKLKPFFQDVIQDILS